MRIQLFATFIFIIIHVTCQAQIKYEKGYIIKNDNQRIECFIRNADWELNPTNFKYSLSQDGEIENGNIDDINEFGIYNVIKYVKAKVHVDQSSVVLNRLSDERNPVFVKEQVFLKVLVEGKASLFVHRAGEPWHFFYSMGDSITPLVYKRYLSPTATAEGRFGQILENETYKQQLINNLKCQGISTQAEIQRMKYAKKELVKLFVKYNECTQSDYVNYDEMQDRGRDVFNLSIRPGLGFNSFAVTKVPSSTSNMFNMDFAAKTNLRLGVEFEYILPFFKNKWSLAIEPTYNSFRTEEQKEAAVSGGILIGKMDYSAIEFPMSLRYYSFINESSKIFFNASYVIGTNIGSPLAYERRDGSVFRSFDMSNPKMVAAGLGYKYKNRLCVEIRYYQSRNLGGAAVYSVYRSTAVILGYSMF
jgi:hypothetical protein